MRRISPHFPSIEKKVWYCSKSAFYLANNFTFRMEIHLQYEMVSIFDQAYT
jgi:hypothetical protein